MIHQLQAQALAKVGPVVLRNDLKLFYTDADPSTGKCFAPCP